MVFCGKEGLFARWHVYEPMFKKCSFQKLILIKKRAQATIGTQNKLKYEKSYVSVGRLFMMIYIIIVTGPLFGHFLPLNLMHSSLNYVQCTTNIKGNGPCYGYSITPSDIIVFPMWHPHSTVTVYSKYYQCKCATYGCKKKKNEKTVSVMFSYNNIEITQIQQFTCDRVKCSGCKQNLHVAFDWSV